MYYLHMLTQARLKQVLTYDPDSGTFTRIKPTWKRTSLRPRPDCYIGMSIDNRAYPCHRLAWLYVYGSFPDGYLDHINGDRHDNRIANLRPATRSQNHGNSRRPRNNTSGFKGVIKFRTKWLAQITKNNRNIYLGTFNTPEAAHAAYCEAAQKLFGEFARAA